MSTLEPVVVDPVLRTAYRDVIGQLDLAESYLARRASFLTWWRGTRLQGTWGHIHGAQVGLVDLLDRDQLDAFAPRVLALVEKYLKPTEPERIAVAGWFERLNGRGSGRAGGRGRSGRARTADGARPPEDSEVATGDGSWPETAARDRQALAAALQACYERIGAEYQRLRRFQGSIIVTAVLIVALVGGVVALGAVAPEAVPLCFPDPDASVEEAIPADATVCPSGVQGVPTGGDAATVVLFGLLGAALTGVRFLVRPAAPSAVPITATRSFQALLKAAIGMLAAILGLLFLRAGVVPGFTRVDTRSQILVYAVVFGAAQELVTRVIDQRSNTLLKAVTSAEPEQPPGEDSAQAEQ